MPDEGWRIVSDPAEAAAQRAWDCQNALGMKRSWAQLPEDNTFVQLQIGAAREMARPIRELVEQIREFGQGPSSPDWWDGVQYILDELDSLIYSSEELA